MSAELAVNSFWFLSILSAFLYISKKKYKNTKQYSSVNKFFQICFAFSIGMLIIGLYLMLNR
tara:strand:- start:276 stop:461 length:186 start_codon:yes stop_codon:yes gene_type:complete